MARFTGYGTTPVCRFFFLVASSSPLWGTDYPVNSSADSGAGTLRQAILDLNSTGGVTNTITINLGGPGTITLASSLPTIQKTVDISSVSPVTVDGTTQYRLIVATQPVTITNMTLSNGLAVGGTGGTSQVSAAAGGGGLGAGGAIYIDRGQTLSLTSCTLSSNKAQGGHGGNAGGVLGQNSSGGGGASFSSASTDGTQPNGGGDFPGLAITGGAATGSGFTTGYGGGNGGAGAGAGGPGGSGGGSGAGANTPVAGTGGDGGYCGGGGGGGNSSAGGGGDGGGNGDNPTGDSPGGGGGGYGSGGAGGTGGTGGSGGGGGGFGGGGGGGAGGSSNGGGGGGGFGGGGGGGGPSTPAQGGLGGSFGGNGGQLAGAGNAGGGGGGAGIGGAIFVGDTATLTILDSVALSSNTTVGGAAGNGGSAGANGTAGTAFANDIFLFRSSQLIFNGTGSLTASFAIDADPNASGGNIDAGIVKQNSGTVTLSGTNTYRGTTQINGGTLAVSANANLGSTLTLPGISFNGGTLEITASFDPARAVNLIGSGTISVDNGVSTTFSGNFTNTGALTKSGAGTLTLSGTNSYSGGTTISGGVLAVQGGSGKMGTGTVVFNNGTLRATLGDFTDTNNFNLTNGAAGTIDNSVGRIYTLTGNITLGNASSSLTKTGAGTLILTPGVANTYSGSTVIATNGGILKLGNANALPSTTPMTLNTGGTLNINGFSVSIGTLSGTGGTITNSSVTAATLTVTQSSDATYAGAITQSSGAVSLTKAGGNTLILSGTNTYSGATTINAGTLQLGSATALPSLTPTTLNGGTLDIGGFSNSIGTLTGVGGTTITNSSVTAATLTVTQGSDATFAGNITQGGGAGALSLTKAGANTLTVSGTNTYSGTTTINAGTLKLGSATAFPSLTPTTLGGGTLDINGFNATTGTLSGIGGSTITNSSVSAATLTVTQSSDASYLGAITGAVLSLIKTGANTLTLAGGNTFAGGTTLTQGAVSVSATGGLGSGVITFNGGTLASTGTFSDSNNIHLTNAVGGAVDVSGANVYTLTGNITLGNASSSFTKSNTGTLILTPAAANTYSGSTVIAASGGTLKAGNANAFPTTTPTTLNAGGTLDINGFTVGIGTLSGTGGTITNSSGSAATLTVTQAADATYAGNITGATFSLTKAGANTLIVSGNNTYSGSTTINAGTLKLGSSTALPTLTPTTLGGGTLDINGFSNSIGTLTGIGGSTITNSSVSAATLTITQSSDASYLGSITGAALALIKTGANTLTLAGGNTFAGGTTLTQGAISVSATGGLGSGVITFNGGTLASTGTFSDSNDIHLTNGVGGTVDVSGVNVYTLTGNITLGDASSSFTKTNTGTLLLTPATANTYSGSTTIATNGGTLKLGNANALSSGTTLTLNTGGTLDVNGFNASIGTLSGTGGTITNSTGTNATLTITQAINASYTGSITGANLAIAKTGAATLTLAGGNTYGQGTAISQGAIAISATGSLGTGTVTINSATLSATGTFSDSNTFSLGSSSSTLDVPSGAYTLSGAIGGAGTLNKTSGGTLVLSNNTNNYSGGTTITTGTLQLGASNVLPSTTTITINGTLDMNNHSNTVGQLLGSGAMNLQGSGALTINTASASSFSGTITSSGGTLTNSGGGTLTLTGNNSATFNGQLINNAGSTVVGNVQSLSADIFNDGTLIFNQTTDATYAGTVNTGVSGDLVKQGAGYLNYTGILIQDSITVSAGTFGINNNNVAFFTNSLNIQAGATVQGTGVLIGNVTNFGTLSPGNSIGTITFIGNYIQEAGSTLLIELAPPDQADRVNATGVFTIVPGATLELSPTFGSYNAETTVIIVSAGSVTGTFSNVLVDLPSFQAHVVYFPSSVALVLNLVPLDVLVTTGNAGAVARCLVKLSSDPDLSTIIDELRFMSPAQMQQTLEEMQPSLFKGFVLAQEQNTLDVTYTLLNRHQSEIACSCKRRNHYNLWASPFLNIVKQKSEGTEPGFVSKSTNGMVGVDFYAASVVTGLTFAYSHSNLHWQKQAGKGSIESWYGGWYISGLLPNFFCNTSFVGASNRYTGYRNIHFIPSDPSFFLPSMRTAIHHNPGYEVNAHFDLGGAFGKWLKVRPIVSADYIFLHEGAYQEHGAGSANLRVQSSISDLLRGKAGVSFLACLFKNSPLRWISEAGISYIREWRFRGAHYNASFVGTTCNMHVEGLNPKRRLIAPMAKLTLESPSTLTNRLSFSYEGEFGKRYHDQQFTVELSCGF